MTLKKVPTDVKDNILRKTLICCQGPEREGELPGLYMTIAHKGHPFAQLLGGHN